MLNRICLAKWDLRRAAELTGWWQRGEKSGVAPATKTNRFSHFNLQGGAVGGVNGHPRDGERREHRADQLDGDLQGGGGLHSLCTAVQTHHGIAF